MRLAFAAATDPGIVRRVNEDRYVADPELGLFVVVDGMGGHGSGDVASATIVDTLTAFIRRTSVDADGTWPFGLDPQLSPLANRLQAAIRSANLQLAARVHHDGSMNGSGATLAAALFGGGRLVVSNVGDCRVYLLRGGTLTQITRDHSLVAEQVALGLIDPDEARRHPLRHVVTRAVCGDLSMIVDLWELPIGVADRVLLCSDGIHGVLSDAELADCAAESRPLQAICAGLVEAANARGGPDNATAVIVEVTG